MFIYPLEDWNGFRYDLQEFVSSFPAQTLFAFDQY